MYSVFKLQMCSPLKITAYLTAVNVYDTVVCDVGHWLVLKVTNPFVHKHYVCLYKPISSVTIMCRGGGGGTHPGFGKLVLQKYTTGGEGGGYKAEKG